jgi:hypothetical protein
MFETRIMVATSPTVRSGSPNIRSDIHPTFRLSLSTLCPQPITFATSANPFEQQ